MRDTYHSGAQAEADRAQQKLMLVALNASDRALRRDECGAWCISGTRGTLHTWGDGKSWALYVSCNSGQHWTWVKKKLSFCTMTQDADTEGVLRLDQLPTPNQANVIRHVLGIQKRREVSAEVLDRLKAFAFDGKPRSGVTVQPYACSGDLPASEAHPASNADFAPDVPNSRRFPA